MLTLLGFRRLSPTMSDSASAPILTIDPNSIDHELISRAANVLRDRGLVAIPTETVYGLGCNALDADAVAGVFAAKARPGSDPLIVHVDGIEMANSVVDGELGAIAAKLANAFWPGPLTLILPKGHAVPDAITSGGPTVGVRCPSHPVASAIITAAGVPVAAPSANRFGRISPTSAAHVVEELGDRIDLIVDAGRTEHGLESTVVAVAEDYVTVLRHGAITSEQLAEYVTVRELAPADEDARAAAPGHDVRHYSPGTRTLATTTADLGNANAAEGMRVVYAGYSDQQPTVPDSWTFEALGARKDLVLVGQNLYDTLWRLDAGHFDLIVVELSGAGGIGKAIDDRLTRAASGTVITDRQTANDFLARWLDSRS